MTPLFTIIIPVYGVEPFLRKCLESVQNQTCPDYECICVDDGSMDGSAAVLDEFLATSEQGSRFCAIHQWNGGGSVARNTALDLAIGEWLQFLDSDDSLKGDFLERLSSDIAAHPDADAIEHAAIYCFADGRQVIGTSSGRLPPETAATGEDILADPFGRKYTSLARCSCYKIFRRAVIAKADLRFAKGIPVGEDELFATLFYSYAGKVAICPKTAGYLRIFREGSALLSLTAGKLLPRIRANEILFARWKENPTPGMTVHMAASLVMLAHLGNSVSKEIRAQCIEALLKSQFFNRTGIPFLMRHGTWKARLFGLAFWISPTPLQRWILQKLR